MIHLRNMYLLLRTMNDHLYWLLSNPQKMDQLLLRLQISMKDRLTGY